MTPTELLACYATRYALGRQSGAAHDVTEAILSLGGEIGPDAAAVIARDIREAGLAGDLGADCVAWRRLLRWLARERAA